MSVHGRTGPAPGQGQENRGAAAEAGGSGANGTARKAGAKKRPLGKAPHRSRLRREEVRAGPEEQRRGVREEAGEEAEQRIPDVRSGGAQKGRQASSPHRKLPRKEELSAIQVPFWVNFI